MSVVLKSKLRADNWLLCVSYVCTFLSGVVYAVYWGPPRSTQSASLLLVQGWCVLAGFGGLLGLVGLLKRRPTFERIGLLFIAAGYLLLAVVAGLERETARAAIGYTSVATFLGAYSFCRNERRRKNA